MTITGRRTKIRGVSATPRQKKVRGMPVTAEQKKKAAAFGKMPKMYQGHVLRVAGERRAEITPEAVNKMIRDSPHQFTSAWRAEKTPVREISRRLKKAGVPAQEVQKIINEAEF